MARAMRPVVFLMLLATILFVVDGVLDHNFANQPIFDEYKGVGWTSFVFAVANLLMTLAVARGSERTLLGRIALSAFFIAERPATAFVLGPKSDAAIAVHAATAVVELVILIGAVRLWRLGHSVLPADEDAMFSLEPAGPIPARRDLGPAAADPGIRPQRQSTGLSIGLLTLLLALILVADGIVAGFVPGGREWGLNGDSSGWLVYLFAVVALTVSTRAVHGGSFALRLLFALSLILFMERAFSPFALRVIDPVQLALHGVAALAALALALSAASGIRAGRAVASPHRPSPAT